MKRLFYLMARRALYAIRAWREYWRPVGPFFFKHLRPDELEVSPVREEDIELLERFLPSKHAGKHRDRLDAQKRGAVEYLVARRGIPVGYVLVVPDPKDAVRTEEFAPLPQGTGYMEDLYIHPSAQGKGIGRLLWEAGERRLREKGYRAVLTTVMLSNPRMEPTHLRKGYRLLDSKVHEYRTEYTDASGRKRAWSTQVKYFIRDL